MADMNISVSADFGPVERLNQAIERNIQLAIQLNATAGQSASSTNQQTTATNTSTSAQDRFTESLKRQAETAGKTRSEIAKLRAETLGLGGDAGVQKYIKQLETAEQAMHKFSVTNSASIKEMGTMLGELLRGNFANFEKSAIVLANRSNLLALAFSPVGLAAGAVAAGLGILAFAAIEGQKELTAFNNAMLLTNGYSGLTRDSMNQMASVLATQTNTSIGKAKDAFLELAKSGKFAGDNLQVAASVVINQSRLTGQSIEEVAREYEKLPDEPLKWAESHNRSMHTMSMTTLQHVRELEEMGKKQEAVGVILKAQENQVKHSADNLGYLETAWTKVGNAISNVWESMKKLGTTPTVTDQLTSVTAVRDKALAALNKQFPNGAPAGALDESKAADYATVKYLRLKRAVDEAQRSINGLTETQIRADYAAKAKSEYDQAQQTGYDSAKKLDEQYRKSTGIEAYNRKVKELDINIQNVRNAWEQEKASAERAGKAVPEMPRELGPQFRKDAISKIKEETTDTKGEEARKKLEQAEIIRLQTGVNIRKQLGEDELAAANDMHQRGLMNDDDYFNRKRDIQVQALQDEEKFIEQQLKHAKAKGDIVEQARLTGELEINEAKQAGAAIAAENEKRNASDQKYMQLAQAREQLRLQQMARNLQYEKDLRKTSMSDKERTQSDAKDDINQQFDQELAKTRSEQMKKGNRQGSFSYDTAMSQVETARQDALKKYEEYTSRKEELDANWEVGATRAMKNYVDNAKNVAGQMESVFSNAFQGMEDALVSMVTTGKLNFKGLVQSILADIARMLAKRAVVQFIGLFGGMMFGGGSAVGMGVNASAGSGLGSSIAGGATAFAADGGIMTSQSTMATRNGTLNIAEKGAEGILPLASLGNGKMGVYAGGTASGGDTYQISLVVQNPQGADARSTGEFTVQNLQSMIDNRIDQRTAKNLNAGGLLNPISRT